MEDGGVPRHGTKLAAVVRWISEEIERGRLVPGQRLTEADFTDTLGISRSLLREALRHLAAEGMVEIVPNRGALVRRLARSEAMELFQIRTELEAMAAGLAAARMADACAAAEFRCAVGFVWDREVRFGWRDYIAENAAFHGAIVAASGNRQLERLTRRLQLPLIMAQVRSELSVETLAQSLREHRMVAEAILRGDGAEASQLMRRHLNRAQAHMRSMSSSLFRPE